MAERAANGAGGPRSLSVIVPTFERPEWIKRAVRSLARQTHVPDEVLPVARDTDPATHASIAELSREGLPFPIRQILVSKPGFMPPVAAGLAAAKGDVIAVLDDDAEAFPDWAERLFAHYADPSIGSVGGRCINMIGDAPDPNVGTTSRVGYIDKLGRLVGDMWKEPTFDEPVEVFFTMGGTTSYRRSVAARLEFDWVLNKVVASSYEVDLGLQVRNMGYRILFDPKAAIRHYSAPRAVVGDRVLSDATSARVSCHNETRVLLRRLRGLHGAVAVTRTFVLGSRVRPGLVPWALAPIAKRAGYLVEMAPFAMRGRVSALGGVILEALPGGARGSKGA